MVQPAITRGSTKRVEELFVATETDVLRDTDLRQAPGPGAVGFWAANTVADGTISIRVGGASLVQNQVVGHVAANSPIKEQEEAPVAMAPVIGGELLQVDVVEVTAMSMRLVVIFIAAG